MSDNDEIMDLLLKGLEKVEEKCDKTLEKVSEINRAVDRLEMAQDVQENHMKRFHEEHRRMNDILDENTKSLIIHEKRTTISEKRIEINEDKHLQLEERFKPIEKRYNEVQIIKKFLASKWGKISIIIGIMSAIAGVVMKFIKF